VDNKAAFLHDMLHRDISSFNISQYPDTAALKYQRAQSLCTFGQYWLDVLDRGYIYQSHEPCNQEIFRQWQEVATMDLIKAGYMQWCSSNKVGQFNILNPISIGRKLSRCYTKTYPTQRCIIGENLKGEILYSKKRVYGYKLNSHANAINAFCEAEKLCPISLLKNADEEQLSDNNIDNYFNYDDVCDEIQHKPKRANRLLELLDVCEG
jgi:hypothetical protein